MPTTAKKDMYMKIDGVDGDSGDQAHQDWIEIEGLKHEVTHKGQDTADSAVQSDVQMSLLTVVKRLDRATPILVNYCTIGKVVKEIKIELCRAMGDKTPYMSYTLSNCLIVSDIVDATATTDTGEAIPLEFVRIGFRRINWKYTPTPVAGGGKKNADVEFEHIF